VPSPGGQDEHHAIRCIFGQATLTRKGRTAQYAEVYRVRGGKSTEHWHLAVDPKAEEECLTF
jgi:hypothetical protein